MVVFGHGGNTIPRMPEMRAGLEKLDLLVVADPHPTTFAAVSERKDGTYLLPICTQFETRGSRTASNRSLQWGHKIVDPIFESKDDYEAMYLLARKLGIAEEMFKHIAVEGTCRRPRTSSGRSTAAPGRSAIPASRPSASSCTSSTRPTSTW
jgi:formate dehydrogenase major subunit